MEQVFNVKEIAVKYEYIRNDIEILLDSEEKMNEFFSRFKEFFIDKSLGEELKLYAQRFYGGEDIEEKFKVALKSSFTRIFEKDTEHFKGAIGELLLCYYYQNIHTEYLWDNPPKVRSSAEQGIDYVVFIGNEEELESIKFIFWEIKTSDNPVSSRTSEILKFFNEGSFYENLNSEIMGVQEKFLSKDDSNLKKIVKNMFTITINKEKEFCIGACGISSDLTRNSRTFSSIEKVIEGLSKEQRQVKIFIMTVFPKLLTYLKDEIWNKL